MEVVTAAEYWGTWAIMKTLAKMKLAQLLKATIQAY
jgi:hypothetical protein